MHWSFWKTLSQASCCSIAAYPQNPVLRHGVFAFEHPTGASSWRLPEMQAIMEKTGVQLVTFHQCRFGLASPISIVAFTGILLQQFMCWTTCKQPIRKSTRLLTKFPEIAEKFHGVFCKCAVPRKTIQGSEQPFKCSENIKYCERYPPELCFDLLADFSQARWLNPHCIWSAHCIDVQKGWMAAPHDLNFQVFCCSPLYFKAAHLNVFSSRWFSLWPFFFRPIVRGHQERFSKGSLFTINVKTELRGLRCLSWVSFGGLHPLWCLGYRCWQRIFRLKRPTGVFFSCGWMFIGKRTPKLALKIWEMKEARLFTVFRAYIMGLFYPVMWAVW